MRRSATGGDVADSSWPASQRIRERLLAAGHRFHANDNVAEHIRDGELDELRSEVEARMAELLRALVGATRPRATTALHDGRLRPAPRSRRR